MESRCWWGRRSFCMPNCPLWTVRDVYATSALLVKAHWRCPIQIWQLWLPFYPRPNISDRFFNLAHHFTCIQIFQIDFEETKWTFFISIHAKETFVNKFRKEKGTSWTLLNDPNIWCNQVVRRFLQNNICYFRSPISPWRAALRNTLFSNFFLQITKLKKCKKFRPSQTPL